MKLLRSAFVVACAWSLQHEVLGQWQVLDLNTSAQLYSVHYRAMDHVLVGGVDTVHVSVDQGDTFVKLPTLYVGANIFGANLAVHAFDPLRILFTGTMNLGAAETIYLSVNGGLSYDTAHYADVGLIDILYDLEFTQAPLGLASGSNGRILRTTNNGSNWTVVHSDGGYSCRTLAHAGGGVYLTGRTTGLMRSVDAGLTWGVPPGAPAAEWVGSRNGTCFAVSSSGTVWRSADQGANWAAMGSLPEGDVQCMAVLNATTLLVATGSALYRSHTSGAYWEVFALPGYQAVQQMDLLDAANVIAVGDGGYALRTVNGGGPALPIAAIAGPSGVICTDATVVFTSNNDPAYTYQWLVDGAPAGSAQQVSVAFDTPGLHEVALVVHNGFAPDTATVQVNATAPPQVAAFQAAAVSDTVCANANVNITIEASEAGTAYALWRNGAQVGGWQYGNSGTLNFMSTGVQPGMVHVIRGARTNSCGTDTMEVAVPIFVLTGSPGTAGVLINDSLCVPASTSLEISGALPGFRYRYASPTLGNGPYVQGNLGAATLQLPSISTITPPTHSFTIEANYIGTACLFSLPGTFTLNVFSPVLTTDLADATIMVGQQLDWTSSAPSLDLFNWTFGADASLSAYVGPDPPPVSWATAGTHTVALSAVLGSGICSAMSTAAITVLDQAPTQQFASCSAAAVSGDIYVADMHLDAFNNRYITGQYHGGAAEVQRDLFVMKVDSTGGVVWQRFLPVNSQPNTFGIGITSDLQGNAYVTVESSSGNLNAIDSVMPVHSNWVLKLDLAGRVRWVMSSAQLRFRGVVRTADNLVHVAAYGAWNGARVELPNGPVLDIPSAAIDPAGGAFALITLDPSGALANWNAFGQAMHPDSSAHFAMTADDANLGAATAYRNDPQLQLTAEGDLLISGIVSSQRGATQFSFDGMPLVNHCGADTVLNRNQVFAARMVSGGTFIDGFTALGGDIQRVSRVARAVDGSYRIVGRIRNALVFNGTITDLGMPSGGGNGPYHGFVASVNTDGSPAWCGTAQGFMPFDAHAAADGDLLVLAAAEGVAQIPAMAQGVLGVPVAAGADRVLLSYSPQGVLNGADQEPMVGTEVGYRMAADACGNLHTVTVTGLTGALSYTDALACTGCTGNVHLDVLEVQGCSSGCAPGYDPDRRDAAVLAVNLSDGGTEPSGPREILADLQCMGGETISSMQLTYRINGGPVQIFDWTGVLAYGQRIDDLVLGTTSLDDANYHVIDVSVSTVNGTQDMDPINDSLSYEQLVCNAPLQGIYGLGPGAAFPSFKAAEMALRTCGIAATTVFEVLNGDHYDQLNLGEVPGASADDTVLFRSQTGDSAAVHLWLRRRIYNNFSGISIDGNVPTIGFENMSVHVRDSWGLYNSVIELGNADRIAVRGCLLEHVPGHLGYVVSADASQRQSRISIENSTLRFAARGIHGLNSGSQSGRDSILVFRDNWFDRQRGEGIVWTIKTFGQVVEGNRFFTEAPYAGYGYKAMIVGETDSGPIRVLGNTVLRTSAGDGGPQLQVRAGNVFPGRSLIANNMVMMPQPVHGMAIEYPAHGGPVDIVHNTLEGSIRLFGSQPNDVVIRNNLVNAHQLVMRADFSGGIGGLQSDHNVFWSDQDTLNGAWFTRSGVGHTLASWQSTFGLDANSTVGEAQYVAADDHHLDAGNYFFCPVFPGLEFDIDGDPRGPLLTWQGADEGSGNVGLQSPGSQVDLVAIPNPSAGNCLLVGLPEAGGELRVHDALGALVHAQGVAAGTIQVALSLALAPGSYSVSMIGASGPCARTSLMIAGTDAR